MTGVIRWVRAAAVVCLGLGPAAPGATLAQEQARRPFDHEYHEALSCTDCHTTGGQHGVQRNWTAETCASCHHDPARGMTCDTCHERDGYADPRPVAQTLHLSVWKESRTRDLSFDHHLHVRLECRDCHAGAGLLEPPECASCHQNHHRVGVECAQCHRAPDAGVHGLEAHASCGGSGCHSDMATRRPMLSRASCLICHPRQREHMPGRECAACHFVPQGSSAPASFLPWARHGARPTPFLKK
jgi:hypothetical protein